MLKTALPDRSNSDGAMFIDNSWRTGQGRSEIEVENPATGEIIGAVPEGTAEDAHDALQPRAGRSPRGQRCLQYSAGNWFRSLPGKWN